MEIFKQIAPLKAFLQAKKSDQQSIGFVPTMGALHNGHISLIQTSKLANSLTVCSIFVNPAQFNNPSDLTKYPRTLDKDIALLEKVECDVIFCPESLEMYPEPATIKFDFGQLDKVMEGKFRPGHFSGVALVVSKLFNIVEPHRAYFGQKDWQQFSIIRQMVDELQFNLELFSVPTSREADGLAMSSRNLRLSPAQRQKSTVFYRALTEAKTMLQEGMSIHHVNHRVREIVESDPEVRLEYFEVANRKNLNILENVKAGDLAILCIAGFVGEVRLIDNIFLE